MTDADRTKGIHDLDASLAWLMDNTLDEDGRRMTAESLAYQVQRQGVQCSSPYISHLRTGRRSSPSAELLAALGEAGGVPIQYFTDPEIRAAIQTDGPMTAERRHEWIDFMTYVMRRLTTAERHELLEELKRREAEEQ